MKRLCVFFLTFSLIFFLFACAAQAPNVPQAPLSPDQTTIPNTPTSSSDPAAEPSPSDPVTPAVPITPALPEPETDPVLSIIEQTDATYLNGTAITLTTPKVELQNELAAQTINQYFTMLSGKVRDYAEGDLTSTAALSYTVLAKYHLTYRSHSALSFTWTVETITSSPELPGSASISAVTFDPSTGALLTFEKLFGDKSVAAKNAYVSKARTVISQRVSDYYYFDQWNELAATALDDSCYYLTEQGICMFYSKEALGTYTEVLLRWDELTPYLSIKL